MLTRGFVELCDAVKDLCNTGSVRQGAEVRIRRFRVEVVTQIKQWVFAFDTQFEYFFEV
jgi:hypothetical protein